MDVEVEEVAKQLFPDGIHDSWKDSEEFSNYIIQLASCGVEKLGKEGAHLREERAAILDQTRDLAYTNYKTFIHTADCSRTIYKDFTSVESHLEGLSSCLPNLRTRVDCFVATSRNLAQSRHLTSLTLTKHTQLLEILELPQLMDTCVRNGYYEEALEILAYVRRLEKKHIDIPIIAGIVTEVQSGTRLMLSQLLAQLRSPLALPQCLKVIATVISIMLAKLVHGDPPAIRETLLKPVTSFVSLYLTLFFEVHTFDDFSLCEVALLTWNSMVLVMIAAAESLTQPEVGLLRRLDVFTEPELRLKFLQARDSWFSAILKGIPKEDAYQHIIKVVEASRVHLFDIVTQYRAIFSDDDTRFSLGDPEVNEQAIFHGWILHKVNQFIKIVEKDLERGVGTNLEAVLAQCMFFGQSFSRIGADFRNLLIPLFQKAALSQCEKDIRTANIKFDETLSSFSLMEAPQLSISTTFMTETQDKTRPPLTLMEFPPLAHYMNGLVTAFNNLRQCCPVATLHDVNRLLHKSLTKVIAALLELHRLESSGFTAREEAAFLRMCSVVAQGLLPHVNNCLRLLYPLQQISLITGVPVSQLQRENFGLLNLEELLAPVEHLLPKKEEKFSLEINLHDQVTANEPESQDPQVAAESLIVDKISEIQLSHATIQDNDEVEKAETPQGDDLHNSQEIHADTAPKIFYLEGTTEGEETYEDQLPTGDQMAVHEGEVSGSLLDPDLPLHQTPPSDLTPSLDTPPPLNPSEPLDPNTPLNAAPSYPTQPSDPTPSLNLPEPLDLETPLDITPSTQTPPSDPTQSLDTPPSLNPPEPLYLKTPLDIAPSTQTPPSDPTPSLDTPPSVNPPEPLDLKTSLDITPSTQTPSLDTPSSLNQPEPLDLKTPLSITSSDPTPSLDPESQEEATQS